MMVSDNKNHKHEYNEDGLCRCGAYRGFNKKKRHESYPFTEKVVTIIECSSCHGKGKNARGYRCLDCNGTGTIKCES